MGKLLAKSIFSFVSSVLKRLVRRFVILHYFSFNLSFFSERRTSGFVVRRAASIRCSPTEQPVETCETVGGPATG